MAVGHKNYFRHSFFAHEDPDLMEAIEAHGVKVYFHFFVILELCGRQCDNGIPEKFVIHARELCNKLRIKRNKLVTHLLHLQYVHVSYHVRKDNQVELLVPNFPKYIGSYQNNYPNKIKENKRGIKEKVVDSKSNTNVQSQTPTFKISDSFSSDDIPLC